ncbi:MAG TPA: histidine--tRNA ligase [Fimbriimonas sp.]|nr:histidine--tRNA ligase [Fimbriimonas sp.]
MRFQSPRGTADVLPGESYRWQRLEHAFRELVSRHGYSEIRTPTFEETELFTRSAGETSDIVTKEMYVFEDKGGRSMTLKPEGTAGVMRAAIQHHICPQGATSRLYYIIPIFRYERPQKGRLREAHQVGLELIGSPSPLADAEVIEITVKFYEAIGLTDIEVTLNSIGRGECRQRFREAILSHMASFLKDRDSEFITRVEKNPLRLIDSKDPDVKAALHGLPPITDFLEPEGRANYEKLQEILTLRKVPFRLNPSIARGLDYYTDTVFEVISSRLGSQDSLCGGGRYDNLVKELGGSDTPSVGVAMGIERALIVLEESRIKCDAPRPDVFVVTASPAAWPRCMELADTLRAAGLCAVTDADERSLRSQLKQADRVFARFAAIIGEDELPRDVVQLRELDTGNQVEVGFGEVAGRVGSAE